MTDYEMRFYDLGKNINRLVATMVPWEEPREERTSQGEQSQAAEEQAE